ncbi:MAG: hypothetical protein Q9227_004626 [Pyrenula ochraceoflavens]
MKPDPALLRALSLDPSNVSLSTHGGSGFASILKLTTPTKPYFVKISPTSSGAERMFEGEHTSLNAIHNAVPSLCPQSYACGKLDNSDAFFLATEFLDLGGLSTRRNATKNKGSGMSLAQKLGKLHTTPAPVPDGYTKPMYGFPVPTCCGDTPQPNKWHEDWASFFAEDRLRMILELAEKNNGRDSALRETVEKTVRVVVPRLLGEGHLGGKDGIKPVVVHGDLWSGNEGTALVTDYQTQEQAVEDMVFDPSACYAHSEFELGIMRMFGGFGGSFMKEYHQLVPKTEPGEEYEDRVALYESYHHLNHYAIFGGSYKSGAMGILRGLVRKYANNDTDA